MATCNFTVKWLESVKPGPTGRAEFFDEHSPGLGLRVGIRAKTFFVMPRVLRQGQWKQERISLGKVGEISLAEAREAAKKTLATAATGQIPTDIAKERRAALVQDSANSFGKVRADFLPVYRVKRGGKLYQPAPRTLHAMTAILESLKDWDDRPLVSITKADIQAWHDGYISSGREAAANRYLAHLKTFFKWAKGRGIIDLDPSADVVKGGATQARERVLSKEELVAIWQATGEPQSYHRIVRLLVLTGQRREEVGGMEWRELDLDAAIWNLPAARAKNRRQHLIPLSAPALDILKSIPKSESGLVFPTRNGTAFNDWSGGKERLDAVIGIEPWRLHDLRRTWVTLASEELGIPPHIVESAVNHVSGFRAGVAGVYNKAQYLDERRVAFTAWADHVLALVAKDGKP